VEAATAVGGVRLSMWRAAVAYRVATAPVCVYLVVRWHDLYARAAVAWTVAAAIVAVTAAVAVLGWRGRAHRLPVVAADVVISALLTLATVAAQTPAQQHGGMPTLTTIWVAGPVLEAAILAGWPGGLAVGAAYSALAMLVRHGYDGRTLTSVVILLVAGAVTGYVATVAVRAEADVAAAAAERAAVAERERLARSIHDGVLQVLGLVHRSGRGAGPPWDELARAAADQEAALRALVSSRVESAGRRADLGARLRQLRRDAITVSTPADPVELDAVTTEELAAATEAALHNVELHAGARVQAWVLLEREDDTVTVTIRDDGIGFPAGRLDEAAAAGRMGVRSSICGRLADLGGHATVTSAPGRGTVVRLTVAAP
jgi:signal transduction histidine kinase